MNELDILKQQIEELKGKLTGNMMEDMELRDKIHNLEIVVYDQFEENFFFKTFLKPGFEPTHT